MTGPLGNNRFCLNVFQDEVGGNIEILGEKKRFTVPLKPVVINPLTPVPVISGCNKHWPLFYLGCHHL